MCSFTLHHAPGCCFAAAQALPLVDAILPFKNICMHFLLMIISAYTFEIVTCYLQALWILSLVPTSVNLMAFNCVTAE